MLRRKIFATVSLTIICILSVYIARLHIPPIGEIKINARYMPRSIGDPKAKVWVVQYMEFGCPECVNAAKLLEDYRTRYPNKMYWQVRYYPRNRVRGGSAQDPATYAECAAAQGKFWPFFRLLNSQRDLWFDAQDRAPVLASIAMKAGVDQAALTRCIGDNQVRAQILAQRQEARELGVRFNPTFFVNGQRITGLDSLKAELDKALAEGAK